jgi:hypothetical protein
MASTAILLHESPRRSQRSEHARKHSLSSTRAPCSQLSLNVTSPSPVEEHRTSLLATKSITGLHTLFATIRSKSNDPQSRPPKHPCPHSASSIADISSLDVSYRATSSVQARQQPSNRKPDVRPDLSVLVPDYLDDPPPYSSSIRERQEVIDWKAHFDRTPILTRTVSPHAFPAIHDVMSPATSSGGAWDRAARRLLSR